jgi:hypothetical protein
MAVELKWKYPNERMEKQTTGAEENKTERLGGENKTESDTIP